MANGQAAWGRAHRGLVAGRTGDSLNWRLHSAVVFVSLLAEWIGVIQIPLQTGAILLLPLITAFMLGLALNPSVTRLARQVISAEQAAKAIPLVTLAILPFIAKFGTLIGPSLGALWTVGAAMVLQELGNLLAMVIALPVAVVLMGMGREAIGACYSIGREPNVALIADRYGLSSPEGRGVMGVYVMGTMFGTVFFALLPPLVAATHWFDMRALAMACGVGSASMTAACSGSLAATVPDMKGDILALAGGSNLLTNLTGLYVGMFVALPAADWLYRWLARHVSGRRTS